MSQEYIRQFRNVSPELVPADYPLVEDFEATLFKWAFVKTNATGTGARDTTKANRGEASCKISTGATTPAVGDEAYIVRSIGIPRINRTSLSAWFRSDGMYDNYEIKFDCVLFNPSATHFYTVKLRIQRTAVATNLFYLNDAYAWVQFATLDLFLDPASWIKMEIVVDLGKEEYAYAVIAGVRYPLTGAKLCRDSGGDAGRNDFMFDILTTAAAVKIFYVDDIIIGPEI